MTGTRASDQRIRERTDVFDNICTICTDACGAPDGSRTRTQAILSGVPLPLGYGGRSRLAAGAGAPGAATAVRAASSIATVSRPVKVFCWLT